MLCFSAMESGAPPWQTAVLQQLLRRLHIVVEHHRHHRQSVDARDVVGLVLAEHERRHRDQIIKYRAALEDAVRSLLYGIR
jgi:hypothetical protein